MTIFKTAYDTLVGRNLNIGPIQADIEKGIISDNLALNNAGIVSTQADSFNGNTNMVKPIGIMGNCRSALKIPFFSSPLLITKVHGHDFNKEEFLAMDYRSFTMPINPDSCSLSNVKVRSRGEYDLAFARQVLSLDWITNSPSSQKANFKFAGFIFSRWITQILTQRFNLYFDEALVAQIITSFYYQSLYEPESTFTERDKQKFAIHTIKTTKARPDLVFKVFDKIEEMKGIDDYCRNIYTILENVKLKSLTPALLITITGNSWFGMNSKEILSTALEYPPEFTALVYTAATSKSYSRTILGDLVHKQAKAAELKEFTQNFEALIHSYSDNNLDNNLLLSD